MTRTPTPTDSLWAAPLIDGSTYDAKFDADRLGDQSRRVWELMRDGNWRTLREISVAVCSPEASVSARLRDLRKPRWGGWVVERRRRGEAERGLFEYRVLKGR